jgi:hypothetical protein
MSNKGNAYALASAIYAGTAGPVVDIDDLVDRVYRTIDKSPFGSDDAKADLYAQLAESLTADTTFERAVNIIEAAMDRTEFYCG